jgi:prepilin peptidase CpaA
LKRLGGVNGVLHVLVMVFPFAMAFAAATDLLTMRIPNVLTVGLAAAFVVVAPIAGLTWSEILSHFGVGALMLLAGISLFSLGWVGGGDAKLLAAAALWLGFEPLVLFLAYVSIFGGALALAILAYRRFPAAALPLPGWALRLHAKGGAMPYGVAIAAGALFVYPLTGWHSALAG